MNELNMNLTNCYGIQNMDFSVDYSNNNVAVIYAPNGTMKSSLAKTLRDVHDGKEPEEKIFGRPSNYKFSDENGDDIDAERIMVINPFDENVFEGQGLLMANESLRKKYISIHKSIDDKKNDLYSGLKNCFGFGARSGFDARNAMLTDWGVGENEEFECIETIISCIGDAGMSCPLKVEQLKYDELFNEKAIQMIVTGDTAKFLEDYEKQYNEIIEKSPYMQRGIIDHNNYGAISTSLGSNGFFEANNKITLTAKDGSGSVEVHSSEELENIIKAEKERVLNTDSVKKLFEKINKAFSKNKDTQAFAALLQANPDLVIEYKNVELFKKKVWIKAFEEFQADAKILLDEVKKAQRELAKLNEAAKKEKTDWDNALELFKQRFYVPFDIEAANQEDVILKEAMPSFKYIFKDELGSSEVTKENMLSVLSTGERRAYYILNMIFQVLVAQKNGRESFLVLDDVSESFDYRNKYAIIEYIKDIAEIRTSNGEKGFKILILTHNFDFYRTIASRISKGNSFIAYFNGEKICLDKGKYTRNLFGYYKTKLNIPGNDNIIVASIPFVRNLIEYTEGVDNPDYLLLTSVLHSKDDTDSITLKQIEDIFNNYWCTTANVTFSSGRENEKIIDILFAEADKISDVEKIEIENKLILAMALRQKAERYMKDKIVCDVPNGEEIISDICLQSNQSGRLVSAYKKYINDSNMDLMEIVAMITPENIHLNSFMFEPILDMSLRHLYAAYQRIICICK